MQKYFRFFSITMAIVVAAFACTYSHSTSPKRSNHSKGKPASIGYDADRTRQHANQLEAYVKAQQLNSQIAFLVDMRIPSGKNRFFVYDLSAKKIRAAGLVTHGSGSTLDGDSLQFSNVPGSSCTSLGHYRVGKPYQGRFGLAYKLYGLDASNSQAFNRFVVLHSHACVPEMEIAPLGICESLGCPTVSPSFLQTLAAAIDAAKTSIVLWIYY